MFMINGTGCVGWRSFAIEQTSCEIERNRTSSIGHLESSQIDEHVASMQHGSFPRIGKQSILLLPNQL